MEAGLKSATVARQAPSVLRGTYHQLAAKGLIAWETAQDIGAVKAPAVQKNSTPSLTQRQAIALLKAIPADTLQGIRDPALMSVFFITSYRVSAITGACVGHLETDGVEHYLNVTEKRNKKRRKILLDAARPVLAYVSRAGIGDDKEGPLFRPLKPDGTGLERRHLDRKTPWWLVKKYCRAAGIDPDRLGGRGIGIHSLRKTAINDAIRHGASLHEVREFAGHAGIRTTELYFVCQEEDAEVAARRIHDPTRPRGPGHRHSFAAHAVARVAPTHYIRGYPERGGSSAITPCRNGCCDKSTMNCRNSFGLTRFRPTTGRASRIAS